MQDKAIRFELTTPIKMAESKSGTEVECNFIELRPPTGKVSSYCMRLENLVKSSIMEMVNGMGPLTEAVETAKVEATPEDSKMTPEGVLEMLLSGKVNVEDLMTIFRSLCGVVAYLGGEKPLSTSRMEAMSYKDLKMMLGTYIATFIMS